MDFAIFKEINNIDISKNINKAVYPAKSKPIEIKEQKIIMAVTSPIIKNNNKCNLQQQVNIIKNK